MSLLSAAIVMVFVPTPTAAQCTGMDHPACPSWVALAGYCTNAGYSLERRKQYCGVRCGLCNRDGSQTAAGGGSSLTACTDRNPNCATWAATGFCSSSVMSNALKLYNCCFSCRPTVLAALSTTTTSASGSTSSSTSTTTTTAASGSSSSSSSTTTTTNTDTSTTTTTTTTTTTVAPGK